MALLNEPLPEPPRVLVKTLQTCLKHRTLRSLARVMSANFTDDGSLKTPLGVFRILADPDNEPVFRIAEKHPDRFYCWVFVNPSGRSDLQKELARWEGHDALIGIKAHPFWHRYPPGKLLTAADLAVRWRKPLLIHAGFGEHGDITPLIQEMPELKLILAHAAFPLYKQYWKAIRGNKRVFVDLSQTIYVDTGTIREVVDYLGPERCLYGTDGPYGLKGNGSSYDYGLVKRNIEDIFPVEKIRRRILGENFLELTGAQ